eukprot:4408352-Heterocapsa_arctica.AAC.1
MRERERERERERGRGAGPRQRGAGAAARAVGPGSRNKTQPRRAQENTAHASRSRDNKIARHIPAGSSQALADQESKNPRVRK